MNSRSMALACVVRAWLNGSGPVLGACLCNSRDGDLMKALVCVANVKHGLPCCVGEFEEVVSGADHRPLGSDFFEAA